MLQKKLSAGKDSLQTKPLRTQGKKLPQYFATLSVCLGAIATGNVLGWTGNITEELKEGQFNNIEIDDFDLKWIGSCATLGAMFMCFPTGIMCEKLGRKLTLLTLTVPFIGGWLLIVFANSVVMIYIGRIITGMAAGAFLIAAPLYLSEIAEKEIRGALLLLGTLAPLGIVIAYIVSYLVNPEIYTIIIAVLPLLFTITLIFQPETPLYNLTQNKESKARAALIRLRGESYDIDAELKEIKSAIEEDQKYQISFKDSIKKTSTKKAALICFSIMFLQQAGGTSAVIFYTSNIFKSSGAEIDPRVATIIIGIIQIISSFLSFLVIDKLGRKVLLFCSALFMAVGLIVLGIFFTLSERWLVPPHTLISLAFMPLLGLSLFTIAFFLGLGPIPWMIAPELFPPEIKGVGGAAGGMFNWFIAFLITNFYFDLKVSVGGDVMFYIFAAVCICGTIFVFFVVPETKGKSLDEIQRELNGERIENKEVNL